MHYYLNSTKVKKHSKEGSPFASEMLFCCKIERSVSERALNFFVIMVFDVLLMRTFKQTEIKLECETIDDPSKY